MAIEPNSGIQGFGKQYWVRNELEEGSSEEPDLAMMPTRVIARKSEQRVAMRHLPIETFIDEKL